MLPLSEPPQRDRQDQQRQRRVARNPDDRAPLTALHRIPVSRFHLPVPQSRSKKDPGPAQF
ncbi:MAG TPA: hypothetical protein VJV22_02455, partial [Acidobacteriaceae bacterium]|nr:hypothetical protein [Acidobacteriaceae bacterium]